MAIKTFNPTTPSRRNMTVLSYKGLSKVKPEKSLLEKVNEDRPAATATAASPSATAAAATVEKYRIIDFKRQKLDMPATVMTLEYDPNRSANIALVQYEDGEKTLYPRAGRPQGRRQGRFLAKDADIKPGNCLPVAVHSRRYHDPQHRAVSRQGRAAGPFRWRHGAQLMAKENGKALVRLPSGELRNVRRRVHGHDRPVVGNIRP